MTLHATVEDRPRDGVMEHYLETLGLVERLHRLLLDVIKDEFERLGQIEINAVQSKPATCTTNAARSTGGRSGCG